MESELKKLSDDALLLPVRQRATLAHILLSSLDEDQQDVYHLWAVELEKRIQDIRSGKVKGIPAAEVFAKLQEKYH